VDPLVGTGASVGQRHTGADGTAQWDGDRQRPGGVVHRGHRHRQFLTLERHRQFLTLERHRQFLTLERDQVAGDKPLPVREVAGVLDLEHGRVGAGIGGAGQELAGIDARAAGRETEVVEAEVERVGDDPACQGDSGHARKHACLEPLRHSLCSLP